MAYHIESYFHGKLADINAGRYTTKATATIAAVEAQTDSDYWTAQLQAKFDAELARDYRSMIIDDEDATDRIAGLRRIAPRYTFTVGRCAGRRCNHA